MVPDALDALAGRQYGLATREQMLALGISRRQVDSLTATGRLLQVRRGVYRWCGTRPSWHMMAMAALLAAGPGTGAVLSYSSAGIAWGLLRAADVDRLEITATRQLRLSGVRSHRDRLQEGERATRSNLPVTSIERTLVDLGSRYPAEQLGSLIDEAIRLRYTTARRIGLAAESVLPHRGCVGVSAVREALAERGVGYDPGANDWEQAMDRLYDGLGLPAAARQHKVKVAGHTYVLDRAIVDLKIAIEWNGRERHGSRSGYRYDARRKARLIQLGWMIVEVVPDTRPEEIRRTILAAVAQRKAVSNAG